MSLSTSSGHRPQSATHLDSSPDSKGYSINTPYTQECVSEVMQRIVITAIQMAGLSSLTAASHLCNKHVWLGSHLGWKEDETESRRSQE